MHMHTNEVTHKTTLLRNDQKIYMHIREIDKRGYA